MRKGAGVRYIKPEVVRIGDTVRMSFQDGDIETSSVGVVGKRVHAGRATEYYSPNGMLLGVDWRDGVSRLTVTLIKSVDVQPVLEGME